jgi:hypothetical protein
VPLLLLIRIRFEPFNPTYTTCYPAGVKGEGKPMADPKITKIETVIFEHDIQDMGTDYNGSTIIAHTGS